MNDERISRSKAYTTRISRTGVRDEKEKEKAEEVKDAREEEEKRSSS